MDSSENLSLFGSVIYRAIGEPEYWQRNSVEPLLRLLTNEYGLDGPGSIAHIDIGKDIVGQLSEKETLVSAVMTVLDGARYGLLIVDQDFNMIYHNDKLNDKLESFFDDDNRKTICARLRTLVAQQGANDSGIALLKYRSAELGNLYLRSVEQSDPGTSGPTTLHYLMLADSGDGRDAVSKEVSDAYNLSSRELSIVEAAVRPSGDASSMQDIADALFISRNTLKTHLKSIYSKTGVSSISSLVSVFLQHEAQQLSSYFGGGASLEVQQADSRDKFIKLSSGQRLCYREYGDPEGKPLIVLHNNYSSRLNIPPQGDAAAASSARRIIIPDRPGYGRSVMAAAYPERWPMFLSELADALGLPEFDLLANSLSVRLALEFCSQFPRRVNKLMLTSPLLHKSTQDKEYFGESFAVATLMFEKSEEIATEVYKLWHASMATQLDEHIKKNLETTISTAEKLLAGDPAFISVLQANFAESSAQGGIGSAADFTYCFRKCALNMSEISTPVEIWIGSEDSFISAAGVRRTFADLPNCSIIEKEGFGEHIYYSLFDQIIGTSDD